MKREYTKVMEKVFKGKYKDNRSFVDRILRRHTRRLNLQDLLEQALEQTLEESRRHPNRRIRRHIRITDRHFA